MNHIFLSSLYSDFNYGNVQESYTYLSIFHFYLNNFLDKDSYRTTNFYIFSDKKLDGYFLLIDRIEEILSKEEFKKFQHGDSALGVVLDYIDAIIEASPCFEWCCFMKNNTFQWILFMDEEEDLFLNNDVVWWSYKLLKLVEKKIPLLEIFFIND